jgi:hypothetical protein
MKSDHTMEGLAHLWLYSSGVDPECLDTAGVNLIKSLTHMFKRIRDDGRREAAAAFLQSRASGMYPAANDAESTGEYDTGVLQTLLHQVQRTGTGGMQ